MERYLAHRIIHQGQEYRLSLLGIECRHGVYHISITPFQHETPGTSFHNGTIAVCARKCSPEDATDTSNHYHTGTTPPELIFF